MPYCSYKRVFKPQHHRHDIDGYVKEHILIMEKVLGKPIILPEIVHHIDGDKRNNAPENLEAFSSSGSHVLRHKEYEAFNACGNSSFKKCWICKEYDDPNNLIHPYNSSYVHKECRSAYCHEWYKKRIERKTNGGRYVR